VSRLKYEPLNPGPFLKNAHVMTIAAALWPRKNPGAMLKKFSVRHFEVAPGTQLLAECLLEPSAPRRPTLVIVHGLEGSSRSPDILNLAVKAAAARMNVVCLNLRCCGNTMHLSPTLYNGGMSDDVMMVVKALKEGDGLQNIFLVGYSLGGNIILKLAGELGSEGPEYLSGICAISPAIDLDACVQLMEKGVNRFYEQRFLIGLKQKIRQKNKLFPERYPLTHLPGVRTIRAFDTAYTAPDGGYSSAEDYYSKASSISLLDKISVPTLMIVAKDDPMVPFSIFSSPTLNNPSIRMMVTDFGGHGGFLNIEPSNGDKDIFWAENRAIQFCAEIDKEKVAKETISQQASASDAIANGTISGSTINEVIE
jgi:predicted alpha/beta-fold hydrolase